MFLPNLGTPIKILGYTIDSKLKSSVHVTSNCGRAKYQLKRLYRFKAAPLHVKRHLVKALVLPILIYPSIQLTDLTLHSHKQLQIAFNASIRFITDEKLSNKISSKTLHEKAKMTPLNLQLNKILKKSLYKIRTLYQPTEDELNTYVPYYKNSQFELTTEIIWTPKTSMSSKIKSNIVRNESTIPYFLDNLPLDSDNFPIPEPIYVHL